MYEASQKINRKSSWVLCLACAEWIACRLSQQAEISDALLLIEEAWSATETGNLIDLIKPLVPKPLPSKTPDPIEEPLWLAKTQIFNGYNAYRAILTGKKTNALRGAAFRAALIAEHISGPSPLFKSWLWKSLEEAKKSIQIKI